MKYIKFTLGLMAALLTIGMVYGCAPNSRIYFVYADEQANNSIKVGDVGFTKEGNDERSNTSPSLTIPFVPGM